MIVRVLVAVAALALAAVALWHPAPRPPLTDVSASPPSRTTGRHAPARRASELVVYVVGAVRKPGLYRLALGARAVDAVASAGGLTPEADPAAVNLAAHVADGDEVLAPAVGQVPSRGRAQLRGSHVSSRHRASPPPNSVDVNSADAVELARVPGIGHAVAQRIVEMRERTGTFASLDELLDVSGMTAARLERARPYLLAP